MNELIKDHYGFEAPILILTDKELGDIIKKIHTIMEKKIPQNSTSLSSHNHQKKSSFQVSTMKNFKVMSS